ncbi:hypothetical protein [Nocardia carnea]|uniref:hypothetical protein n=1 Tax=Nocardia carnea TaxID=37328 RepID=UPI002456597B|nr:hypothetical protein [Nocardia carnea]
MTSNKLGLVDFQLYLLKTMQPPRTVLDPALTRLNSTTEHMLASAESISKSIMPGKGGSAHALKSILHNALINETRGPESETLLYRLPLWEEFAFRLELDNLPFMKRVEFVDYIEFNQKAAPWRLLEIHISERFDEVREIDSWGTYNSYTVRDPETGNHLFLRFSWGLLQEVDTVADQSR